MGYRKITLMMEFPTSQDKDKLIQWCEDNDVKFCYRYERDMGRLYYFWVYGNTEIYRTLNKYMGGKLLETDFAEFGNLLDCSDEELETFISIISENRRLMSEQSKVHGDLCRFIKDIQDLAVLEHMDKYVYIEDCKRIVEDKISSAKGKPDSFDKWIKNHCGDNKFNFHDFNIMNSDENGHWIRIEELNDMIERRVVKVDRYELEKYHKDTREVY